MNQIIAQHYYEGSTRELQGPRAGKIDHIPLKPVKSRLRYTIENWIIVFLLFIVLPALAYWVIEVLIK